ncbi:PBAN-type neuropeptides-like [Zerene cesonia]|uniref:PBAN-type neuropeptides-like n=1 Tax=Zerene cesonia TaxID=33412 RepID=UPI0018E577E9|nr:PBAN-type neuropeptides-like [Zerene cesonia]
MAAVLRRILFSLLVVIAYSFMVDADDTKDEGQDRGAHGARAGVWFGPRLGKRSQRNGDSRVSLLRLIEAADLLRYYYDQLPNELQNEDNAIFSKLGRSTKDNVEFTPRLGRRQTDQDMPSTNSDYDIYRQEPMITDPRSNHFSPRLGRNYNFSPRLGRELSYALYPSVRVVRSVNDTKSN